MPFALVLVGLLMVITGANNTYQQFGAQLKSDFTGNKSFIYYVIALGAVGALGYINDFRRFSHYFMTLILISLILSNKGFFQNFMSAINTSPVAPTAAATAPSSSAASNQPTGTGSTAQWYNPFTWSAPSLNSVLSGMMNGPGTTQP